MSNEPYILMPNIGFIPFSQIFHHADNLQGFKNFLTISDITTMDMSFCFRLYSMQEAAIKKGYKTYVFPNSVYNAQKGHPTFSIGSHTLKCCKCGVKNIQTLDTMFCPDCELEESRTLPSFPRCSHCGKKKYIRDGISISQNNKKIFTCYDCIEKEVHAIED